MWRTCTSCSLPAFTGAFWASPLGADASGHLYEIPHVTKVAECVTVVLQEDGKGATWMFEDAYAKHKHWHKVAYRSGELEHAVDKAADWAEKFVREFANYQAANLPWLKK